MSWKEWNVVEERLRFIARLLDGEKMAGLCRDRHARPILDQMRSWLDQAMPQVPPKSTTGQALHYLHNEWDKLNRYLDDGRLEIDNNLAENAIRPFVIGWKNWIFSNSVRGVKASANLYSLIETAKANGLEPYAYLRYLFADNFSIDSVKINKSHYLAVRCDLIAYLVDILALLQDNTPNTALRCFGS